MDKIPKCPVHHDLMVVRTARSGSRKGQKFYGCPTYFQTRCTETINIDPQEAQQVETDDIVEFDSYKNCERRLTSTVQ